MIEIIDLDKNTDKEIELARGEEKTFVWRLFSPAEIRAGITFLLEEGAKLKNIFLFSAKGANDYDIGLKMIHSGRGSFSDTFIRGVARGKSRVSISGEARAGAEAKQASVWVDGRALLFEDANCRIDPRLEILTSEVEKAGHAAAVSRIQDDDIFYMATRGVEIEKAERLKSRGFLSAPLLRLGLNNEEAEEIINPLLSHLV